MGMDCRKELLAIYELLNTHFGDLHWWPADDPFEVMVGAILTQNTAWSNVEKAIAALKQRELLSPEAMARIGEEKLAEIIRPSGYYRVKAKRLKEFIRFLTEGYCGDIDALCAESLPTLREKLLRIRGVGPETADSILLYACGKPVFISDAYTQRILERHNLIPEGATGDRIRALFLDHLPHDAALFNQFHALLVYTGKNYCRKKPKCMACPLRILFQQRVPV